MNAKVIFPATKDRKEITIRRISEVNIESSWKTICDTGTLILPRNVKDFDSQKVKEIFHRGDPIEIYLGYGMDEDLQMEFSGYLDKVSADYPITLKLEDQMWKLKQLPVNEAFKNIKLKPFIEKIVKDFPLDIDTDISLGAVRFSKVTLGEVLKKIQEDFSLYSFIRNGKLTIAKPYSDVTDIIPVFDLERNCVSNDLNYLSKEERLVKIVGQSIQNIAKAVKAQETDKKLKYEFGDADATKIFNTNFNVKTLKELESEVKRLYNDHKKDGWDGSFTTFGFPKIVHGQKVKLISSLYNEREGIYYCDRVNKKFSRDGFRQEIELGPTYIKK